MRLLLAVLLSCALAISARAQSTQLNPSVTLGWSVNNQSALTNSAVAIKATGGTVGKTLCYNPNATIAYVQLFNLAAASVTVGTTSPLESVPIPPTLNGGFASPIGDLFSTAISAAATTTPTGGSAPSTALTCNFAYR